MFTPDLSTERGAAWELARTAAFHLPALAGCKITVTTPCGETIEFILGPVACLDGQVWVPVAYTRPPPKAPPQPQPAPRYTPPPPPPTRPVKPKPVRVEKPPVDGPATREAILAFLAAQDGPVKPMLLAEGLNLAMLDAATRGILDGLAREGLVVETPGQGWQLVQVDGDHKGAA